MKNRMALACAAMLPMMMQLARAEEPAPEHALGYNLGVVSDYRYRGISQTRLEPALQGGADYSHDPSGLYFGTWLSTIRWIRDTPRAGSTPAEWDLYGGRKGKIAADWTYDVGALAYVYANNRLNDAGLKDANTFELYGQIGYGPVYLKYSHAVTTLFGIPDSRNSGYWDAGANIDLPWELKLNLHAGYQKVKGPAPASYADCKVGVARDIRAWPGLTVSLAGVSTNADEAFYASAANGKFLGRKAVVLGLTKTF